MIFTLESNSNLPTVVSETIRKFLQLMILCCESTISHLTKILNLVMSFQIYGKSVSSICVCVVERATCFTEYQQKGGKEST